MRRLHWSLLLLGLAGCGGGDGGRAEPAPASRPDPAAALRTVEAYYRAFAAGNPRAACRQIDPEVADAAGKGACVATVADDVDGLPRELLAEAGDVRVSAGEAAGQLVRVRGRGSARFTSEPRRSTLSVRRVAGRWLIAELPRPTTGDPVTECVVRGIRAFESGRAAEYWRREGRGDFVAFLPGYCREYLRRLPEADGDLRAAIRLSQDVSDERIRAMAATGRVRLP